jgi:hypothetical protein
LFVYQADKNQNNRIDTFERYALPLCSTSGLRHQ